ncbi:MAG TPA: tRNA (adenosine(37)-N6)-threonylcarbamoyltransferase complex dimerization subunit type 1 TsaB [Gemmatimonadales bacterium]
MSLFLALETATAFGSVAVGGPDGLEGEVVLGGRRQGAALTPAVMDLLRHTGRRLEDLDGIVMGDGPGGFTGLRIGFATAQGFLREHPRLELRRVPSLMGAAWIGSRFADGPVAALYDALRGEVFAAVYRFTGTGFQAVLPPTLTTASALRQGEIRAAVAVGDGARAYADDVVAWTGRPPVGPPWGGPRAAALLDLLALPEATTRVDAPFEAEPDYGRAPAAQTRWEERHGRPLPDPGRGGS